MTVRVAINGFGRIGRNVVRALYETEYCSKITVVAINELADSAGMVHLLKYDTSHGRFAWNVRQEHEQLFIGKDTIRIFHKKKIEELPWNELDIDIVLDCTGVYGSRQHGQAHLEAGAKKVIFSHLGGDDLDATIVYGVNHEMLHINHHIISNASCTTNCVVPIIKIIDDSYEIKLGSVTTIHSSMHDQRVIETYHSDLRRARSASQSIIPVDTKLNVGITRIFPKFKDCFEATAVRVPTINVTAIDLSLIVKKPVKTCSEVKYLLKKAAKNSFFNIIDYVELPLVSTDFNHNPYSAIVDGTQIRVNSAHLIKMLVWCDNEWGFANRMLDTTLAIAVQGFE